VRPGEPVNKVFVQFSNDLEGFLPYTLVISEEQGLEFTSLSTSPDFALDPLGIIKADRIGYNALMRDAFFINLSRSIMSRPELQSRGLGVAQMSASHVASAVNSAPNLEDRVRPPYVSVVQLSVRRTLVEGGQVLVFKAVQSEPLAEELVRSCYQLKKRRATRHVDRDAAVYDSGFGIPGMSQSPSPVPTRGFPTPRTVVSRSATPAPTPGATPLLTTPGATPPPRMSPRPRPVSPMQDR